jgi:hypothetical protein
LLKRFGVSLAVTLIAVLVAMAVAAAASPQVKLKAASSSCRVGHSVKLIATVSGGSAYEVGIYEKSGRSWNEVVTATLVSTGVYSAYVKCTAKGAMQLKAGIIDSSGDVTAWSNVVSVNVTG